MQTLKRDNYGYGGYWDCVSKCGLTIFKGEHKAVVLMTELPDNEGTSITNVSEDLAKQIYNEFLSDYSVKDVTWFEHYPADGEFLGSFDKVVYSYSWNRGGLNFSNPKRSSSSKIEFDSLVKELEKNETTINAN